MSWLRTPRVYVRFGPAEIHAVCLSTGREFRDSPVATLEARPPGRRVLAIGSSRPLQVGAALSGRIAADVVTVNPFNHERVVLADFEVAEAVVRHVVIQVSGKGIQRRPELVLHPHRVLSGGLTDIEERALLNLAASVGATRAVVHQGPELTKEEAMRLGLAPVRGA